MAAAPWSGAAMTTLLAATATPWTSNTSPSTALSHGRSLAMRRVYAYFADDRGPEIAVGRARTVHSSGHGPARRHRRVRPHEQRRLSVVAGKGRVGAFGESRPVDGRLPAARLRLRRAAARTRVPGADVRRRRIGARHLG